MDLRGYDFSANLHKFNFGDIKILLDVNSSSYFIIDPLTWDFLDALAENNGNLEATRQQAARKYGDQEIARVVEELAGLWQEGCLFTQDDGSCPQGTPSLKALCLHLAHSCNLRCSYCFASQGAFGGRESLMPFEVGKKAIDLLLSSSARKQCEIDFFGGEPLLNFSVMKDLVGYGKNRALQLGKNLRFTLTTNGVLLDREVQDFINEEGMSVVLSLDGRKEVNDRVRIFPDGAGCYEHILPKFQQLVTSRNDQNYYIRGTYTRQNLDFSRDASHLISLGFSQFSLEPVVAAQGEFAFRDEDLPAIYQEYENLTRLLLEQRRQGQNINFFHFNLDLSRGPCLAKRVTGCGAGYEYLAVTPEGELFPCHQFVGNREFCLGNVYQGVIRTDISRSFQEANVYHKPSCTKCWARFLCSGGCHANAYNFNKNITEPHQLGCNIMKKRLECAIYFQVVNLVEEVSNTRM